MKVDFKQIRYLLESANLTEISKKSGIPYRTLQDWKYGNSPFLDQAEERLGKLQEIYKEEKKMKLENIKNWEYIWEFDDLGDHLNNGSFTNQKEFDWWEELADALAFLEEETEIDVLALEVNELQEYIDVAEEMKKIYVDVLEIDEKGAPIDIDYDANVGQFDSIEKAEKAAKEDFDYLTPHKNAVKVDYIIYREGSDLDHYENEIKTIEFDLK